MEPLVSILIPAFNAQRWIADTIESALQQTWPRKEIIVVDDGSDDCTLSVARQFEKRGVVVVTQKNQGAVVARNTALTISQGDYIQWLDADDLLASDKITRQMETLKRGDSKRLLLSSAWGCFRFRTQHASFQPTALWCDLSPLEWLLIQLEQNLHMQTATWLVSHELADAAGPWDVRLRACASDDGEYFCRVILASEGIRFVSESKVYYRIVGANRLSYIGRSSVKMEAQFLGMQLYFSHLRSREDSERTRAACVKYMRTWLIHFYPECPHIVQQAQDLAAELGSYLEFPRLPWKYLWIQKIFGWMAAKRVRLYYNQYKSWVLSSWDKTMFHLEKRRIPEGNVAEPRDSG